MRTPQEVFEDYAGRRRGIIKALTTEADDFYALCDPNRENLTLFAFPDGTWAVDLPAEEVPPEVPEPALGINFARDGMHRKDWLGIVAVHSDSWLLATAFYKGARFDKEQRQELFSLINKLPTCFEVVSGKHKSAATSAPVPAGPAGAQPGAIKRQHPASGMPAAQQGPRPKQSRMETDDDEAQTGDGWQDGEGDPCPLCRRFYSQKEFWIACDECDRWYCGRCTKMTALKAERIKNWLCPECSGEKISTH